MRISTALSYSQLISFYMYRQIQVILYNWVFVTVILRGSQKINSNSKSNKIN